MPDDRPDIAIASTAPARMELEPHQLQRPLATMRVPDTGATRRLERSLEMAGQLNPCVVVAADDAGGDNAPGSHVLIDGYRRVAVLQRLRRDTVWVECWTCSFAEALVRLLAGVAAATRAPLEEALMLRELVRREKLSQHALARRTGRDVSWVSRRLSLLDALSGELLGAVCAGDIAVWSATRVLAPLARANGAHAEALLHALRRQPMSTRQLSDWQQHYATAPRAVRQRMVEQPHLFAVAHRHGAASRDDRRLREGPEGMCLHTLASLASQLSRLRLSLPALLADETFAAQLCPALTRLRATFDRLQQDLERHARHHSTDGAPQRAHTARASGAAAPDKPPAEAVAQHRAPDTQGTVADGRR